MSRSVSNTLSKFAANDDVRRRRLVDLMLRYGAGPTLRRLAGVLDGCSPMTPCRSAACPVCGREFQRRFFQLVDEAIRKPARSLRNRMTMITIIPPSGCVPADALTAEVCSRAVAEIRAGIQALGMSAVASIEMSFNEDDEGIIEPHWCVHGHVIVLDWLTEAQRQSLKASFPPSSLVRRPTKVVELDRDQTAPLYSAKPERGRRVSYIDRSHPERGPCRNTHDRHLRPWQATKLALVEHRLAFSDRLMTHRVAKNAVKAAFDGFFDPRDSP